MMSPVVPANQERAAPSRTYLLAADDSGEQIVSVHVKRTYRLKPDGRCVPAEGEIPLLLGPSSDTDHESFPETDIVPFKGRTDLIVISKAWGHGMTQALAQIRVGPYSVRYLVQGERRVIYGGSGNIRFTRPEPFDAIDLGYANAYGGFDPTVPVPPVRHVIDLLERDPGEYPRNPSGKGYVVFENRERLDGLELPNVENPEQALTPEQLVVGDPDAWWRQPLPWSCDWFPKLWYPRGAHYRALPRGLPEDDSLLEEVRRGWLEPGHARRLAAASLADPLDGRFADAASPALVLPFLRGSEAIELTGMTPNGTLVVQLPGDRPRIQVRAFGAVHELGPVPHRVLISTEEMGVYVVWHAAWVPTRPLPEHLPHPDATMADWLKGVEAFVDGQAVLALGEQ